MSRRLLIALLTSAAVAAGLVTAVVALGLPEDSGIVLQLDWTTEDACPDAVLIGAAGSGQRDDILGVGPQVESVVSGFDRHLREQSSASVFTGFIALDYPAPGIVESALQGLTGDGMLDSIAEGRETMTALVRTVSEQCQDAIVYLIGYSQGASVVHAAVVDMPTELQISIGGAVVLADPYRDADDANAQHFTTEPDAAGLGTSTEPIGDGSLTALPLPNWVQGSFYSACARRDTVCSFALRDLLATDSVHTENTYNGLGPMMGGLLADNLLSSR